MSSATWTKRSPFFYGSRIHGTSVFVYSEDGGESWVCEVVSQIGVAERSEIFFASAAAAMEYAHQATGKKTAAPGQPTRNAASPPSKETEGNLSGAGRP